MSVLIKGMEMPKNCGECHFCHTENFHQWCCLTEETISAIDAKHFMCPLTQLEPCEDAVPRTSVEYDGIMNRNLDGIYLRVKRDGKYQSVCLSDMTADELEDVVGIINDSVDNALTLLDSIYSSGRMMYYSDYCALHDAIAGHWREVTSK